MTTALENWFGARPSLIMFDLDGTLVDSVPDIAVAVDIMRRDLGLPEHGEDKVRHWVGRGAQVLLQKALADIEPYDERLWLRAQHAFGEAYAAAVDVHTRLYQDVETSLAVFAAWCPLVCITNKPLRFTKPLLQSKGLADFFQLTLGGDSFPEKKPHPRPLLYALEHFGVAPEQALMVGDSRNDVEAARAAEVRCIALTHGYNHGEPIADCRPDWIVDSFRELL